MASQTKKRSRGSKDSSESNPSSKQRVKKSKKSPEDEVCAICLEPLLFSGKKNLFSGLNCDHFFHATCISQHCKQYDCKCPLCRRPLFENISVPTPVQSPRLNHLTLTEIRGINERWTTPLPLRREETQRIEVDRTSEGFDETPLIRIYASLHNYGRMIRDLGWHPLPEREYILYRHFSRSILELRQEERKYFQAHGGFFPWRQKLRGVLERSDYSEEDIENTLTYIKFVLVFMKKVQIQRRQEHVV